MRKTTSVTALVVVVASLVTAGPAMAQSPGQQVAHSTTGSGTPIRDTFTTVTVPFTSHLSLDDAVSMIKSAESDARLPIVALRFENPQIIGEWNTRTDQSAAQFLQSFQEIYGTVPQISAAVFEVPATVDQSGLVHAKTVTLPRLIDSERKPFVAPPARRSAFQDKAIGSLGAVDATPGTATASTETAAALSTSWYPQGTYNGTWRPSSTHQLFMVDTRWGTANKPQNIPGTFGVEIEINLNNGEGGTRPVCTPGYKDRSLAKNYNYYSWSVSSIHGVPTAVYPYADINDLFDPCGLNSMTIGLYEPQKLPSPAGTGAEITTFIDARVGTKTSTKISGGFQLVNASGCSPTSGPTLTDCMGIPTTSPPNTSPYRFTLNPTRNWSDSPNRCWESNSYGSVAPVAAACP